jgi:hypothetical protein
LHVFGRVEDETGGYISPIQYAKSYFNYRHTGPSFREREQARDVHLGSTMPWRLEYESEARKIKSAEVLFHDKGFLVLSVEG